MLLIVDLCSALMIASLGKEIFVPGKLPIGDLALHPRVFREVNQLGKDKKTKYAAEIHTLKVVSSTANLATDPEDVVMLRRIAEEMNRQISQADATYLAAALRATAASLVTNEQSLRKVAEEISIRVFLAEDVLLDAATSSLIDRQRAITALDRWEGREYLPTSRTLSYRKRLTQG